MAFIKSDIISKLNKTNVQDTVLCDINNVSRLNGYLALSLSKILLISKNEKLYSNCLYHMKCVVSCQKSYYNSKSTDQLLRVEQVCVHYIELYNYAVSRMRIIEADYLIDLTNGLMNNNNLNHNVCEIYCNKLVTDKNNIIEKYKKPDKYNDVIYKNSICEIVDINGFIDKVNSFEFIDVADILDNSLI